MSQEHKKRPFLSVIFVLVVLVFLFSRGWFSPIGSFTVRTVSPITSGVANAINNTGGYILAYFRIGKLSRTVRILEEKNAEYEAKITRLSGIEEENKILREQIKLLPKNKYKLLAGEIISRTVDGVSDAVIINRGSNDGIREGMPVIVNDGIVVGKIFRVESLTSVVMLVTDADFKLTASVQGTKAQGLVRGTKGLDVSMDTIPRDIEIHIGDKVVTTGMDGLFPPDLLVGKIRSISAPQNEIFQTAKVSMIVDVKRARIVSVILDK